MVRFFVGLALVAALSGCGTVAVLTGQAQTPGVSASLPVPLQKAQAAVNEANITLIASHREARRQLKDQVMSQADYNKLTRQLKEYGEKVDKAQNLIDLGDPTALATADALKVAIVAFHKQVVARSKK